MLESQKPNFLVIDIVGNMFKVRGAYKVYSCTNENPFLKKNDQEDNIGVNS